MTLWDFIVTDVVPDFLWLILFERPVFQEYPITFISTHLSLTLFQNFHCTDVTIPSSVPSRVEVDPVNSFSLLQVSPSFGSGFPSVALYPCGPYFLSQTFYRLLTFSSYSQVPFYFRKTPILHLFCTPLLSSKDKRNKITPSTKSRLYITSLIS